MNVVRHDHVTPERRTKLVRPALSIFFESALCLFEIGNSPSISGAKRHEVNRFARIDHVESLRPILNHQLVVAGSISAGETPATTTNEILLWRQPSPAATVFNQAGPSLVSASSAARQNSPSVLDVARPPALVHDRRTICSLISLRPCAARPRL